MPQARECRWTESIVDHVAHYVGASAFVLHELESELIHLDVHAVPPVSGRPFWFLFTTGMSALPMATPPGADASRYAELSILLPPYWKLDRASWQRDTRWFWPVRELRAAARLPHRFSTWLANGHTIGQPGPDSRLDPSTRLSSMVVLPPVSVPDAVTRMYVGDLEIDLLTLWPLYPEELDYKLSFGAEALALAFGAADVCDVIDPNRPSALDAIGEPTQSVTLRP